MSRLDALRALKNAVEDGTATYDHFNAVWPPQEDDTWRINWWAWRACANDLNAARALHDAVRPGWAWGRQWSGHMWIERVDLPGRSDRFQSDNPKPARAWLLAVIASLIDEDEGK